MHMSVEAYSNIEPNSSGPWFRYRIALHADTDPSYAALVHLETKSLGLGLTA